MITINLSFYNQNEVLKRHVESWKSYPPHLKDLLKFCIIDDCSKTPAIEVLRETNLSDIDLAIYRIEEDLYCNIAGGRNLAAQQCTTEWMILLDMDTMIPQAMASTLSALIKSKKKEIFKFNRRVPQNHNHPKHNQPHPAVCLLRTDDYWDIGGNEEDFVGHYGWTDPSFWHRANPNYKINILRDTYLHYLPEGEADINRDTSHNLNLFNHKKATNQWSTDFCRFKWTKDR
jgi:hypothetical protein